MEVPHGNRQDRSVHSKEWLENNPEARGHGILTGNSGARGHGIVTGNSAGIGASQASNDQPLALVKKKKIPQPEEDAPLDLSVSRQPAPTKLTPEPCPPAPTKLPSEPRPPSEPKSEQDVVEIGEYAPPKLQENHFRCCFCGLTFPSTEVLLEHIRIHTGDEEGEDKSVNDEDVVKSDQDEASVPTEIPSKDSTHPNVSGAKDVTQQSCRVSPDTVSGSLSSFNTQTKRLEESSNHAAAASPGLPKGLPCRAASANAGAEKVSVNIQGADGKPASISQLSNADMSQTAAQYQTTTCEADSTVDIPMSCGQAKTPEPNASTSHTTQDSTSLKSSSSRQHIAGDLIFSKYQCPICKADFGNHVEQQRHQLSCRPPSEKQMFLQSVSLSENLTCPICNIRFPSPEAKNDHHCRGSDVAIQGFNYMYSIADQITSQRHIDTEATKPSDNSFLNTSTHSFCSWTDTSGHGNNSPEVSGRTTPELKKGKVCEGCNKSFEFSRNLSRHLQCNPTCRAVMVAKDPSSVKKGGYRFSFLRSKSSADSAPGTSESPEPNTGTNVVSTDQGSVTAGASKSWSPKGYSCKICGKIFDNGIKLGVHRRWEHRERRKLGKGKKKFKLFAPRKSVRNVTDKVFCCKACKKTFKLESHLELHFTLKKKCRVQHTRMTSLEAKTTNIEENETKDLTDPEQRQRPTCKICGTQYWSSWHLKSHMRACHGKSFVSDSVPSQTEEKGLVGIGLQSCRRLYHEEDVPEVYQHLESKQGQFVCTFCKQGFRQKKIGYNHVLIHLKTHPFKCLLCDYRGRQAACIIRHLKRNHHDAVLNETGDGKVVRNISSGDSLQEQHKQDDNVLDLSSTSTMNIGQVKTGQVCLNVDKPKENSKTETAKKVDFLYNPSENEKDLCQECPGGFKCPFCSTIYASRSRTVCHIRKHTKARPYQCCYCNFTASYSYMIYQHLRRKHYKNRPIKPPSRGKGRQLFTSMATSPPPPPRPDIGIDQENLATPGKLPKKAVYYSSFFKALPIDKKFAPIRVANSELWKCYACAKMSSYSVIRGHALTHTQLKPFHCVLCPHKSVRMGRLVKHLQNHHRKELEAHFGSEAQFDEFDQQEHESLPEEDLEDLCFSNENSTEESARNTVLRHDKSQVDPKLQGKDQHNAKHTSVDVINQGRRSSRGRQIKPQKSLQDDYIYDFTESESDTSQNRYSPLVYDFSESETQQPIFQKGTSTLTSNLPSTSRGNIARENQPVLDLSNKIKVLVVEGSQEKIFCCQCCSFKSNYESVINAHVSMKHSVKSTTKIYNQSTEDISRSDTPSSTKSASDGVQGGSRKNESQKRVMSWFPHRWKGGTEIENQRMISANDTQDQTINQQNDGPHGIETGLLKDREMTSNSPKDLVKRTNANTVETPDSVKTTADLAKKDDIVNAANALYTYIAGPVQQKMTQFDFDEPRGGFKCKFCNERSHGKAAAIAHLESHAGENPYHCDLCEVSEAQKPKMVTHIQEFHMKQVLDIVQKKATLAKKSLTDDDTAAELNQENTSTKELPNAADVDVNANSTEVPSSEMQPTESLPITHMLDPSKQFRMKGIRKKNLSFYKQIIFIRGPLEEKLNIEQDKMTGRSMCPYCKKTFSGRNATKQHSRIHTREKPYYCKLCYHNARNISAILKHLQAQHKDACKRTRLSKAPASSNKIEHLKLKLPTVHISDVKSQIPITDDDNDAKLDDPEAAELNRPESPQVLQEFFRVELGDIEKKLELKPTRTGRWKCPYCKKILINIYNTKRHIRIHTGEKPFICNLCDYKGTQYSSIRFHLLKRHADVAKIFASSKQSLNKDQRQTDIQCTHPKPVSEGSSSTGLVPSASARKCDSVVMEKNSTSDAAQLSDESKSKGDTNSTTSDSPPKSLASAKEDQSGFDISPSKKQWNEKWTGLYTFTIGPMEEKYQKIKRDPHLGKLKCPLCKKDNFREKSKLMSHIRIHTGEKPFKCNLCLYRAAQQSSMVHHIRNYHKLTEAPQEDTSKKNIPSTETQISKKPDAELGSTETDENAPKSQSVSEPKKQLEEPAEMSPEKVQQESEGIASSKRVTGLWTYVAGDIERNLRLKRGRVSRCYKCPYCKKEKFNTQIALKSHVRTHTKETPYGCKLCHYQSRQQSSMRYHIGKVHQNSKTRPNSTLKALPNSTAETSQAEDTLTESQPLNNSSQKDGSNVPQSPSKGTQVQSVMQKDISTVSLATSKDDPKSKSKKQGEVIVNDDGSKDFGNFTFTIGKMERRLQRRMNQLEKDAITGLYLCSYCAQGFTSKHSYVVHVRLHTGEKPYCCKLCNYQSVQHSSMKYHTRSQHNDGKDANVALDGVESFNAGTSKDATEEESSLKLVGKDANVALDGVESFNTGTSKDATEEETSLKLTCEDANVAPDGVESFNACTSKDAREEKKTGLKLVQEQTISEQRVDSVANFTRSKRQETVQDLHDPEHENQALTSNDFQSDDGLKSQMGNTGHRGDDKTMTDVPLVSAGIVNEEKVQQVSSESSHPSQNVAGDMGQVPTEVTPSVKPSQYHLSQAQDAVHVDMLETYLKESQTINREIAIAKGFYKFSVGMVERNLTFEKDPSSDQYMCPFCQRCFPSIETTRKHVRLHTGEKPYHCCIAICKWREFQEVKMVQHIAEKHRREARKAGMQVDPKADQRVDTNKASDAEINVKQVWACISPYVTYTLRDQQACYNCDLCNHVIAGYPQIVTHIVRFHKINIKTIEVYDQDTSTEVSVSKSQPGSTSDQTVGEDLQIKESPSDMNIDSTTVNQAVNHAVTQAVIQAEPKSTCNEKSQGVLNSTLYSVDKKQNLVVIMQQDQKTRQYVCPVCNLQSKEKSAAMSHAQIHTDISSFVCNKCGHATINQADMISHISKTHPQAVLYLNPQEGIVPLSPVDLQSVSCLTSSAVEAKPITSDGLQESADTCTTASSSQEEVNGVCTRNSAIENYDKESMQNTQPLAGLSEVAPTPISSENDKEVDDIQKANDTKVSNGIQNQAKSQENDAFVADKEAVQEKQETEAEQCTKEKQSEPDAETNLQRSAHDHNYARSNSVDKSNKESVIEQTVVNEQTTEAKLSSNVDALPCRKSSNADVIPTKRRRRSTRRSRTEVGTYYREIDPASITKLKDGLRSDVKVKDDATKGQNSMDATDTVPMDATSLESMKSANATSTVSADRPASECSSITDKDKDIQSDKVDETHITNYFRCNIGIAERTLGRNFQRDPVTGFYLCPYCDKSSRLLQTTKIHMRLHTGEKPYECKLCDVKTVQHCSIIVHIKNHHPEVIGITPAEVSRKVKAKKRRSDASSQAKESTSVVTVQVGNRIKKLGSTSPMKTKYKKVSKRLKTAEEDESFVDLQRSQQILEEANLPELKGVLKDKLSQSTSGNLYQSGGVGISGLKRFAQIPIPRLGVTNLSKQFMKVAMEKPSPSKDQPGIPGTTRPETPDHNIPVCDESMETAALDLSMNAKKTSPTELMAPTVTRHDDDNTIPKEIQIQTISAAAKNPDLKKTKRKYRKKKGRKPKKSKLSHQIKTEGDGGSKVPTDDKVNTPKSAVDLLAKYYNIVIGPVEKSLVFEKDPVTHRIMCPYCSMTLSHVWSTYNHVRLHTGERPFRCNLCDYRAVQLTSIKTHLRKNHGDIISTGIGAADLMAVDNSNDIVKPDAFNVYNCFSFEEPSDMKNRQFKKDILTGLIICPHCEATVPRRMLVEHICSHTGDLPYRCKSCEHKTTKRSAIIRHVQMYHRESAFSKYACQPGEMPHASTSKAEEDACENDVSNACQPGEMPHASTSKAGEDACENDVSFVPKDKNRKLKKRQKLKVKISYKKHNKLPTSEIIEEEEERSEGEENVIGTEQTVEEAADEADLKDQDLGPKSKVTKTNLYQLNISKLYTYNRSEYEKNLKIRKLNGKHTCPFCTSVFKRVADTKRHARIHTGDKPYKCLLCGQGARQQSIVISHIEKKHASSIVTPFKGKTQTDDSNAQDATEGEDFGTDNAVAKSVDEMAFCDESEDTAVNVRRAGEEKCQTVVEKKSLDVAEKSVEGKMKESDDSSEQTNTKEQKSVPDFEDMQDSSGPKSESKRCEEDKVAAEVEPEAKMCKSSDNNQGSNYSERIHSGNSAKEARKPIEDILEELLTDVDDSRTEKDGTYSHMSDTEAGTNTLYVEDDEIQKLGKEEETKSCGNKEETNEVATDPEGGCQSKKLKVPSCKETGSNLEKPDVYTAKDDKEKMTTEVKNLEKEENKVEQGKLIEGSKPEKQSVCKEGVEIVCEKSLETISNISKEQKAGTEKDPGTKQLLGEGSQKPDIPVRESGKRQRPSGEDSADTSPPSVSSKSDQGSPTRRGSTFKSTSPRGQVHYSYEPWDDDTCDVTLESNTCMYQCPHCSYRHRTKAVVRTHIRTHTGFKPYHCHYCEYKSTHCTTIKKHLWKEHNIANYHGSDVTSSSSDSDSGTMRSPRDSVHFVFRPSIKEKNLVLTRTSDTGVFICSYCDRPFSTEGNLRIHIRTHTGDKPYHCRHCDFRTAYGFLMQKHINMSHKEKQTATTNTKPVLGTDYLFKPSEGETSRVLHRCSSSDMYKCEECGKEMVHEFEVVAHMRWHSGDKPYCCTHCVVQTMTQAQIVRHVSSVHKESLK